MKTIPEIIKIPVEDRTDRELEISKIILQREANTKLSSIQKNVQFLFWITLLSILIGILAYVISES